MPRKTLQDLQGPEKGSQRVSGAPEQMSLLDGEKPPKEPQGAVVGSTREAAKKNWAVVGVDTSLTSIAAVAYGYDSTTDSTNVTYGEIRWTPEVDYFKRLGEAAKTHELILDLLRRLWVVDPERVYVALEEPFPLGMLGNRNATFQAGFAKQQAEISGAVKGSLVRYGFPNLEEINNSSWHKALREDGAGFETIPRKALKSEKERLKLANKFRVKEWAIGRYGLPDLPDLVASRSGAKITRPESGYGAKARAVQPSDVYDACAVMHWLLCDLEARGTLAL